MASYKYSKKGMYDGYETTIIIYGSKGKLRISTKQGFNVGYEINSDMTTTPASNTATLTNISKSNLAKFDKGDHIAVYSGPKDLFGLLSEGYISDAEKDVAEGRDRTTTITFTEAVNAKNERLYSKFNGSKLVKKTTKIGGKSVTYTKRQVKKVNISFKKGTKAKTIIERICRDAKVSVGMMHLKKNHVYKKGYTVSSKPLTALARLAKDCDTKMYQVRGKVVFDNPEEPNPYNDNLYFSPATGLVSELTHSTDSSHKGGTWTGTCYENPLVMAGTASHVKSPNNGVNQLMRVSQVTHTHDVSSGYNMEVTWLA